MRIKTNFPSWTIMGAIAALVAAGPAFSDEERTGRSAGEQVIDEADRAVERSNAQWREGATRGQERASEVRNKGEKMKGKAKGHREKHGKRMKDAKRKAHDETAGKVKRHEDDARREMDEAKRDMKGRKDRGEKAMRDGQDAMQDKMNKGTESAEKAMKDGSDAVKNETSEMAQGIRAEKANPAPEARGFWARLFGRE